MAKSIFMRLTSTFIRCCLVVMTVLLSARQGFSSPRPGTSATGGGKTGLHGQVSAMPPVLVTTTFDDAFVPAGGNIIPSQLAPITAVNVGNPATEPGVGIKATGWDFTLTAGAGQRVSMGAATGGETGAAGDLCVRMQLASAGSLQTTAVKSTAHTAFNLQSVWLKVNTTGGATSADMTIQGYRSGSIVTAAVLTIPAVVKDAWQQFTVSGIAAFGNVDEFRFFAAGASPPTISFEEVDEITVSTASPLPLTLTDFSGQRSGDDVQLDWTTLSEQNTRSFEVQRATDGIAYTLVALLPAAGNSVLPLHYHYTDPLPVASATLAAISAPGYFYRLKMEDLDGAFTYSPILRIVTSSPAAGLSLSVYPNPFRQQVSLLVEAPAATDKALVTVTDISGKILLKETIPIQKGNTVISLPSLGRLGKGIYLLSVSAGAQKQTVGIAKNE
jgi:hypothetical protein